MEFKISRDDLLQSLHLTQALVNKKSTMPILSNALFTLSENELMISATDLEIGIEIKVPVQGKEKTRFALPAKNIYEIAKELVQDEITFKSGPTGWMEMLCGKSRFKIVNLPAEEFPNMPEVDESKLSSISAQEILRMIDKTFFAVSQDETKYSLNGIFMNNESKGHIKMVATDGHRLSEVVSPSSLFFERGVIVPRKGLSELKKLISGEDQIEFGIDGKNCVVKKEGATLIIRLIDGEFPDYKKVIPQSQDKSVDINRLDFIGALKRVSLLSQDKGRGVKMVFSSGNLEILSSNPDIGEAREELEIDYKGERFEVGFNPRYFVEALQTFPEDYVSLELKDEISPCVIRPKTEDKCLNVIMPMRL